MDAVQVMRQKAEQAGNLKTTPQQAVTTQGSTVIIQPAAPDVVYVPAYNPWVVYGPPIVAWPGWYPYPASGMAGRIFRLESGSESAFSPVLVGAGRTGGLTGTTTTWSTTTPGTIRVAQPFTTAMSITAAAVADRKRSAAT
jgi:hypothetical protein